MSKQQLSAAIDRLVEAAIRRILPTVMNEVLIQTLAGAGVLSEARPRPVRRMKKPKRRGVREAREPVREVRQPPRRPVPPRRIDLNEMLDDSVGSDAYEEYEARTSRPVTRHVPQPESEQEFDDHEPETPALTQRLAALDPSLQAMAEGLVLSDDDGGEMWGDEHDAAPSGPVAVSEVRDVAAAAKKAGMDFSRMRSLIEKTSPPKRIDADDAKARAAFENQRLKRMRERLNDGKPVE